MDQCSVIKDVVLEYRGSRILLHEAQHAAILFNLPCSACELWLFGPSKEMHDQLTKFIFFVPMQQTKTTHCTT
jgi:hypothetical protein